MQRSISSTRTKRFPGDAAAAVTNVIVPLTTVTSTTTVSRHRNDQELRLLAYCLKSALQSGDNFGEAEDSANGKSSECFMYLSECLMGGVIARNRIASGISAYKIQDYKTAYRDWQLASRLCDNRELFYTLNYLISLSFDFGHFGKMLNFSVQQFQIAKYLNDANLMAESYLNMASSRGLLGNWELCLSYCKNCLLYLDATKVGYVYMSIACAYLELNRFSPAVGFLKLTFDISAKQKNYGLVVQTLVTCSGLFYTLKSYQEAREFALRAVETAEAVFGGSDGSARYRRTKVHFIPVQIKLRQLDSALQLCEESVRSALEYHDRYVQAKCLLYFAEIHRLKKDYEIAYQSYQAAADSGYHHVQVRALLGQAKCLIEMKRNRDDEIPFSQVLELHMKVLELTTALGCKIEILRSHRRIARTYESMQGHSREVDLHLQNAERLCDELELFCSLCGGLFGISRDRLKILSCGHVFHSRCLAEDSTSRSVSKQRYCVRCRSQSQDMCGALLV